MVQWDRWHLWSAGTQVQSRAQHSGLKDLTPGWGTPYAAGQTNLKVNSREGGKYMCMGYVEPKHKGWNIPDHIDLML